METANNHRHYSVAEVAQRLAINETKVGKLIKSGEIVAIDVSYKPGAGRPRWRISPQALAAFEASRSSIPAPPPKPRRKAVPRPSREYV